MGESGTGAVNLFCKDSKDCYLYGPGVLSNYSTLPLFVGEAARGTVQTCLGTSNIYLRRL